MRVRRFFYFQTKKKGEDMGKATKQKREPGWGMEYNLELAFGKIAGQIVDTQIEWQPGQNGRWYVAREGDVSTSLSEPRILFADFPPDTKLRLRSLNGSVVTLGLYAASLAISECAINWVAAQAAQYGNDFMSKLAAKYYEQLHYYIHRSRNSGLSNEEKQLIHRYND
jgi:hypothetical protein